MARAAEGVDERAQDEDEGRGDDASSSAREPRDAAHERQDTAPDHQGSSAAARFSAADLMAPTLAPTADDLATIASRAAADAPASDGWIGETIDGRYKIVELLGEGGMGAVYVAENLNLRKQVALKVIRPEYAGDPEIAARFTREAMATASLDHPHVASALDFGLLADGSAFLVIQLVRGRSLSKLLSEQALAWPQACDLTAQIADALAAAHGAGIVHRDLKPDNVLLERRDDGRYHAKVLDFGIARVAEEGGPHGKSGGVVTRMGVVMGTPGYMSPEQAIGERVDHRTDLYALGVVLWECITGRPLWVADSLTELISRQLSEAPPPILTITGQSVPEALELLIAQLLARRPEGRPATAATVRDVLRKLAAGGDGSEVAASTAGFSFGRRTEVSPGTALSTLISTSSASPWLRARTFVGESLRDPKRRMIASAAAAGLVLFAGIAALVGGGDDVDVAEPTPDGGVTAAAIAVAAPAKQGDDVTPAATTKAAAPPTKSMIEEATAKAQTSAELQALIDGVIGETTASKRKAAAKELKERAEKDETVPTFAVLCADLELAKTCTAKKKIIAAIEAEGDARALPALERLAESPRQGCGFLKMNDCIACARKPLATAIKALGEAAP